MKRFVSILLLTFSPVWGSGLSIQGGRFSSQGGKITTPVATAQAAVPFSVIVSTIQTSLDGNTVTTPSIDTTGATLLVLGFTFYTGGSATNPPTVTDSKSNVWTPLVVSSVAANMGSILYYSTNPVVGSGHTFTETASNSFPSIAILAVSGGLSPNVFDQQNGNNNNGGGSSITTQNVTPSADNELLVTVVNAENTPTYTIDSSFIISNQKLALSLSYATGLAYIIKGSGTSGVGVNPTWGATGTNVQSTRIATFK